MLPKPAILGQTTPLSGRSNGIVGNETLPPTIKPTSTPIDMPRRNSAEGHVLRSEIFGLSLTWVSAPGVMVTSLGSPGKAVKISGPSDVTNDIIARSSSGSSCSRRLPGVSVLDGEQAARRRLFTER